MSDQSPTHAPSPGADAHAFAAGDVQAPHGVGLREPQTENMSAATRPPRRFWPIEIWDEHRDAFKALLADIMLFGIILAALAASHFVIERLHYPPERKDLIEKIHFYGYVVIIAVFIGGLILKVVAHEIRGLWRK